MDIKRVNKIVNSQMKDLREFNAPSKYEYHEYKIT